MAGLLVSATLQFVTYVHILGTCQASQQPQEVGRQLKPGHRKGQCPPEAWQGHGAVTPSHSRGFRAHVLLFLLSTSSWRLCPGAGPGSSTSIRSARRLRPTEAGRTCHHRLLAPDLGSVCSFLSQGP